MTSDPRMTAYFREQVLRKRPYLKVEWCVEVVNAPEQSERQADGRWRFWAYVAEWPDQALRVVTLEDRETLHNAFPDSDYSRRSR